MSNQDRKLSPSGKFLTPQETYTVIQLFGDAHTNLASRRILNELLESLGERYGYDWKKAEIAHNGEILLVEDHKNEKH